MSFVAFLFCSAFPMSGSMVLGGTPSVLELEHQKLKGLPKSLMKMLGMNMLPTSSMQSFTSEGVLIAKQGEPSDPDWIFSNGLCAFPVSAGLDIQKKGLDFQLVNGSCSMDLTALKLATLPYTFKLSFFYKENNGSLSVQTLFWEQTSLPTEVKLEGFKALDRFTEAAAKIPDAPFAGVSINPVSSLDLCTMDSSLNNGYQFYCVASTRPYSFPEIPGCGGPRSSSNSCGIPGVTPRVAHATMLRYIPPRPPTPKSQWHVREHSFRIEVFKLCNDNVATFCPQPDAAGEIGTPRNFYRVMNCLEANRARLDPSCAQIFNGTTLQPNPLIFRRMLGDSTQKDGSVFTIGFVFAPLFFDKVEETPLIRTYFCIKRARIQPAKKGMLFVHTGGPLPSCVSAFASGILGFTKSQEMEIASNYDVVSVDQRGMGFSSFDVLFENFTVDRRVEIWLASTNNLRQNSIISGELVRNPSVTIPGEKNTTILKPPCSALDKDFEDFLAPSDWGNESQVRDYFLDKSRIIAKCSKQFIKQDGKGGEYNVLQYLGTNALAHDIEFLRYALGAPSISIVGFSYGTRVTAAYTSQFPSRVTRAAVTGTMAPVPDILVGAQLSANNAAMILGFIQNSCETEGKECLKNPYEPGESEQSSEFYFERDVNAAIDEMFLRSMDGGAWYMENGGCNHTFPLSSLELILQEFLTTIGHADFAIGGIQEETYPLSFAGLRVMVFFILQNPCFMADYGFTHTSSPEARNGEALGTVSVFHLIPSLDQSGRFSLDFVVDWLASRAKNTKQFPALNRFLVSIGAAHGWPQQPNPIGFANKDVPTIIAQALYDERTGMNEAQIYRTQFTNSVLVSSVSGDHCVSKTVGTEAYNIMMKFLLYGITPSDGQTAGKSIPIDFKTGEALQKVKLQMVKRGGLRKL